MDNQEALAIMGAKLQELAEKNLIFPSGGVCNRPVIIQSPQRVAYYDLSDFCLLSIIEKESVNYLLDQAEKGSCQIFVAVYLKNSSMPLPHLQSLDPREIVNVRKNPSIKTIIVLDNESHSIFIDLGSLLISKYEGDRLLAERSNQPDLRLKSINQALQNENNILKKRLKLSLKENIKSINPNYSGRIFEKTGEPQTLILIVMCSMFELQYSSREITWNSIKDFIEEHIFGNRDIQLLSKLEEINDSVLKVGKGTAQKKACQDNVGRYKKIYLIIGRNVKSFFYQK